VAVRAGSFDDGRRGAPPPVHRVAALPETTIAEARAVHWIRLWPGTRCGADPCLGWHLTEQR
jgi:hypothetical protein